MSYGSWHVPLLAEFCADELLPFVGPPYALPLWGLFGAFIGVPIVIAIVTFCAHHPSTRWVADLLGGPLEKEPVARG